MKNVELQKGLTKQNGNCQEIPGDYGENRLEIQRVTPKDLIYLTYGGTNLLEKLIVFVKHNCC